MPSPFYNNIKGITAGAAGTGAYTPSAAATGFSAWSTVPSGWIGLVRYTDGSSWELTYSYWNGTTLSRASTQLVSSSSGSQISLTSAATAAMVPDASEIMNHLGTTPWMGWFPQLGSTTISNVGMTAATVTGTGSNASLATTNLRSEQRRVTSSSATTANAQAGWSTATPQAVYSTAAGRGGFEFVCRMQVVTLPTGPRLFVGMTATTYIASTAEPSALVSSMAIFGKDSTDTNIQFITNDNSGGGNKTDTGIAAPADSAFEMSIWGEPGGGRVYGLLIRLDTGAIWYGSTTTQLPANGALLMPQIVGALSATTGTAIVLSLGSMSVRAGT